MPTGTGAGALAVRAQRALPYRALRAEADAGGRLPGLRLRRHAAAAAATDRRGGVDYYRYTLNKIINVCSLDTYIQIYKWS